MTTETITFHGRTMTFFEGNAAHITGGEGVIMAAHMPIEAGQVLFDVGAGDSSWTLYGLASGATVYAFEPSKPRYKLLVEEVLLNDGFFERAKLHNVGLDSHDYMGRLDAWYASMGGWEGLEITPDCLDAVRFLPLNHYLPELMRLDWIKIDVEGGELRVLSGAVTALLKFRPSLIIENHIAVDRVGPWMARNDVLKHLYEMLTELHYSWSEVPHQGRSFIVAKAKEAA